MVKLALINAFHWTIIYEVYGYPLPNVTWFKDGLPLVQNDVIYDRMTSRSDAMIKGRLMFEMSNHFYNGNYTLVASNVYGNTSQTLSAEFLRAPGMHIHHVQKKANSIIMYVGSKCNTFKRVVIVFCKQRKETNAGSINNYYK